MPIILKNFSCNAASKQLRRHLNWSTQCSSVICTAGVPSLTSYHDISFFFCYYANMFLSLCFFYCDYVIIVFVFLSLFYCFIHCVFCYCFSSLYFSNRVSAIVFSAIAFLLLCFCHCVSIIVFFILSLCF